MTNEVSVPTLDDVRHLVDQAFPALQVSDFEYLSGGRINANLKLTLRSGRPPLVLRLYRDGAAVCRKEMAILQLLSKTVPVPEVLHSEPDSSAGLGAFAILEFVEGITFQQLKRTKDLPAIHQAAYSVGKTLAAIGRHHFPAAGRLIGEEYSLQVGEPYVTAPHQTASLMDQFLASPNCERRVGPRLRQRLHEFAWAWEALMPKLQNDRSLVHSDFGNRNIMVREQGGEWKVAAVLDWEFAFSGSPLLDVGHFLRYERQELPLREPNFSRGFVENGGGLPDRWRDIVRVIDLTALVECLTQEDLPSDLEAELLALIQATLKECAPEI
ncbi:MAG TPA: phosphotransferase [Pyrinomonadaceae bacterium]|nr:phosphotransferase [Pyrinomonadaceae bacterium]